MRNIVPIAFTNSKGIYGKMAKVNGKFQFKASNGLVLSKDRDQNRMLKIMENPTLLKANKGKAA